MRVLLFIQTRGRHEIITGVIKSPDELVDVYTEWIDAYPRCIMLIDPFRYAVRLRMFCIAPEKYL